MKTYVIMEGPPPLRGVPYPTFQCGQNVKVNFFISAPANLFISAPAKNHACFDFDFNILTA